ITQRINPGEDFDSPEGRFLLKDLLAGLPLQITVSAEGYRRHSVRRLVAQPASEEEPVDVWLTAEDPAKLVTVRGKLLNQRGEAVRGAELRLIVANERPLPREAYPFNWQMLESGQTEQVANVLQFRRTTTADDGGFAFERVPGDAEIELVYWGK